MQLKSIKMILRNNYLPLLSSLFWPLLSIVNFANVNAQSLLTSGIYSAGDYKTNGSNNLSFTIGEAITGPAVNQDNKLDQGQQQNFKELLITSVKELPYLSYDARVWPNPASDQLFLDFGPENQIATIDLFDISGKLIRTEFPSLQSIYKIDIADISAGTYFLVCRHIIEERKTVIRFVKIYH